jgi:hypothetical protein
MKQPGDFAPILSRRTRLRLNVLAILGIVVMVIYSAYGLIDLLLESAKVMP